MNEEIVKCPNCGFEISVSKVLREKLQTELESDLNKKLERAKQVGKDEAAQALDLELVDLREQIKEKDAALKSAKQTELELRKRERTIQEKEESLEIEIQRRLSDDRSKIKKEIEDQTNTRHELDLKSKDDVIERLKKDLGEAQRRAEQGSMQQQGEVFELSVEDTLRNNFPQDTIEPVPKGVKGADVMQTVLTGGRNCGVILWECKRTKNWSGDWILKLKEDQREIGAALAIIVTETLPKGMKNFGNLDSVWVTPYDSAIPLALALREFLKELAFTRAASEGKNGKMEAIYNYLVGQEFRQKIEAIVETFIAMKSDLEKEKRAMFSIWNKREKQIEMVVKNTSGMHGEIKAIVGASFKEIKTLELNGSSEVKELPSDL
ncbi:DUF2130 domain-containing protein [candidate division WOR-3 bacterium]|nr:DUF2130 domain-containing protein [candidate division WOR-3 bacterium]